MNQVTVIIPTTAQIIRFDQIRRCVESIRASSAETIDIFAIVNGDRSDPRVCTWLQNQPDVQCHFVAMPSAPNAVYEGRKLVTTEYFSTLDDDDEYLPGGTDKKLATLRAEPAADMVVTNTYRLCDGAEEVRYTNLQRDSDNPLVKMFDQTWLNSGNALFRSASITPSIFENGTNSVEWTWIAFKIAMAGKQVRFLDEPTNRVHVTRNSLSQSDEYFEAYLPLFDRMIATNPPTEVLRLIRRRMSAALHDHSVRALQSGEWKSALAYHLRSLALPSGLRYLSYSRRFFTPTNT